jgi:histidyl-tRNA synthetase
MAGGSLPGFRDFYPEDFAQRAHLMSAWREVARRFAFVEYDGPPLEPLDLYTRKSGDEIVGQLYEFKDKGDRHVALRPEMTPTFARMVAAKAASLRKPVRWFSIPQLFRYERAQRGRLREHFQLNVDIVGEASEVADAELLAVAVGIMQELGLGPQDVRARVSDRRLLNAVLASQGLEESAWAGVYAVLDKKGRQPRDVSVDKLKALGVSESNAASVLDADFASVASSAEPAYKAAGSELRAAVERMRNYLRHCDALGIGQWVDIDLSVVRGLGYYTGIVFELFDAKGELRAICGGGRYDNLLKDLGGVDLPALGFGMGDVVLGELLRERGLLPAGAGSGADLFIIGGPGAVKDGIDGALQLAAVLRGGGFAVDHALSETRYASAGRNQFEGAKKSGALAAIYLDDDGKITAKGLSGKLGAAPVFTANTQDVMKGGAAFEQLRDFVRGLRPPPRG